MSKLKLLRQSHQSQIYDIEDKITKYYPSEIKRLEEIVTAMEQDVKQLNEKTIPNEDKFSIMKIRGNEYTEKEKAGQALLEACKTKTNGDNEIIGEYRGFKLGLEFDSLERKFKITMKNETSYSTFLGSDVFGNIRRIDNALEAIADNIPKYKDQLENTKNQLENAKQEAKKEFPQEQELKEKIAKLNEINKLLNIYEKDNQVLAFGEQDEEKEQKNKEKKHDKER